MTTNTNSQKQHESTLENLDSNADGTIISNPAAKVTLLLNAVTLATTGHMADSLPQLGHRHLSQSTEYILLYRVSKKTQVVSWMPG